MSDQEVLDAEVSPTKKKRDRSKANAIRLKKQRTFRETKILELKTKGLPHSEIAKVAECHPATVSKCVEKFKEFFDDVETAEGYQDLRQKVLNATEFKLLRSVADDAAIEKAPLNQRAYALKEVHNMRRLDANLSTANTSLQVTRTELMPDKLDKFKK